jgi:hypothetical protein
MGCAWASFPSDATAAPGLFRELLRAEEQLAWIDSGRGVLAEPPHEVEELLVRAELRIDGADTPRSERHRNVQEARDELVGRPCRVSPST